MFYFISGMVVPKMTTASQTDTTGKIYIDKQINKLIKSNDLIPVL